MGTVVIPPVIIVNKVSGASNITSTPVHVLFCDNIGIQVEWTGTLTGTFGISFSNDAAVGATGAISGGTWTVITGSYPAAAGSAGNGFISLANVCAAFIELTYTAGSGTGNVTAYLVGKAI